MKGVAYKVDCSCGSTYIGETGRTLDVRLKELNFFTPSSFQEFRGSAVQYSISTHGLRTSALLTKSTLQHAAVYIHFLGFRKRNKPHGISVVKVIIVVICTIYELKKKKVLPM